MLEIRLLGPPLVTLDGVPIEVDTKKAIAMLAYLAIETSAERDLLAGLFWADSPPDRARATLRRTLSALRGGVGHEAIHADRQRVRLTESHTSDVNRFSTFIEETASHDHDPGDVCARCLTPLERAADLYRGDFLGSFHVRDAPEFEDWARPVTESIRIKAGEVFQRLAMAHAANGDYSEAIETTARWISLDDLHEPAHRQLMLLHAWAGDRPGAMEAYNACVAVLDRELGVAPLEETTELYEAILDEDLPPAPAQRRTPKSVRQTTPTPSEDMIDRTIEVAAIEECLDRVSRSGQLCVITGDSWMGKTRLIEHLTDEAQSRGHKVVSARAFRAESQLPYGVATQLLRGILSHTEISDIEPWAVGELARLDPRLAPGQIALTPERRGQLRLSEAFLNLVEVTATATPLVVTVDDVQWIDRASAGVVSYLTRRVERSHTMLFLGVRVLDTLPTPLDDLPSLGPTLIELQPLIAEDLDQSDPTLDLKDILTATGGIPLLAKEAIDTGIAPDSPSVLRYMESRRNRLTDLARQVMAAASVLDGFCDAALLRDTSGRTDDEVVEAVEELVSSGLLREEEDGLLAFTLDVLETVTYEATSLIRRRLLHRRAAEAIEALPRARTDARLATAIAGHLRAAGSDAAAEWYRLAGDLARNVFANDEAVASYETAIALDYADLAELRLALGELAMARGDYSTATRELRAAAAQSTGPLLALVEHRIGDLNRILGRFELAEESFGRSEGEHPESAELFADWALLRYRVGDTGGAVELASRAVATAEVSDDAGLARAVNILGVVTPEPKAALDHLDRALDLADAGEPARMAALNNKAHILARQGDTATALEMVNEAIEIARRSGYRHRQAALLNHLADLHHASGNGQAADAALTEAVTIFADIVSDDWEPEVWLLREW